MATLPSDRHVAGFGHVIMPFSLLGNMVEQSYGVQKCPACNSWGEGILVDRRHPDLTDLDHVYDLVCGAVGCDHVLREFRDKVGVDRSATTMTHLQGCACTPDRT